MPARCSTANLGRPHRTRAIRFAVALEHARLAIELQGDSRKTVVEFRKHFGWYTKGLHGAAALRQKLFLVETMAEAEAIFAELPRAGDGQRRGLAGSQQPIRNFPPRTGSFPFTGATGFDGLVEDIVACSGSEVLAKQLGRTTIANTDLAMAA